MPHTLLYLTWIAILAIIHLEKLWETRAFFLLGDALTMDDNLVVVVCLRLHSTFEREFALGLYVANPIRHRVL